MPLTINQVINLHPNTKPDQWHQHGNGGGWVFETATVEISAQVSGDARVYGSAGVFGDASVFGDAEVSGNARVYGSAWETSPLYIQVFFP